MKSLNTYVYFSKNKNKNISIFYFRPYVFLASGYEHQVY